MTRRGIRGASELLAVVAEDNSDRAVPYERRPALAPTSSGLNDPRTSMVALHSMAAW
jgi:hypothetical protein